MQHTSVSILLMMDNPEPTKMFLLSLTKGFSPVATKRSDFNPQDVFSHFYERIKLWKTVILNSHEKEEYIQTLAQQHLQNKLDQKIS